MFTKIRTTAIILAIPLLMLAGAAIVILWDIADNIVEVSNDISIILVAGFVAIISATVGYFGGAMTRLTDDSTPPPNPLAEPLDAALEIIRSRDEG